MTISINNRLTNFAQKELVLGYSDPERERINTSLDQLERVLRERLYNDVKQILRFGSFTRNTILPRIYDEQSDVDLLVIFDTSGGIKTPDTYRRNILDVLNRAYSNSFVKKDFPTVKLELNHIMFDVVPSYSDITWYGNYYFIPGTFDKWQQTTPNDINESLSKKNQDYGDNIVRNVIRLCKHWNYGEGYPFSSYEMEKWIIERTFFHGDNLYDKFLSVLTDLASNRSSVSNAIKWINEYKGSWSRPANEQKQFERLQKLLPGLK